MKKLISAFLAFAVLLIPAGCGSKPEEDSFSLTEQHTSEEDAVTSNSAREPGTDNTDSDSLPDTDSLPNMDTDVYTLRLRIADGAESGTLVLAGENPGQLLTLTPGSEIPVFLDGQEAEVSDLEDGMIIDILCDGMILETFPAQFEQVYSIRAYGPGSEENPGGGYYDLCGLYLQVLNDLWNTDPGLNANIEYISLDLSQAPGGLWEGEKVAVAWIFACEHGVDSLSFSYDELAENGYLTEYNPDSSHPLFQWENGILFTITPGEQDTEEKTSLPTLHFNAEKWRSPLGSYTFSDCTAVWPETGTWSSYQIGSEMIS